jgi:hypothetical protein
MSLAASLYTECVQLGYVSTLQLSLSSFYVHDCLNNH